MGFVDSLAPLATAALIAEQVVRMQAQARSNVAFLLSLSYSSKQVATTAVNSQAPFLAMKSRVKFM